ncbi:MAG: hypothetical protein ACR2HJ_07640 [Fimbriimonadales bacterium]
MFNSARRRFWVWSQLVMMRVTISDLMLTVGLIAAATIAGSIIWFVTFERRDDGVFVQVGLWLVLCCLAATAIIDRGRHSIPFFLVRGGGIGLISLGLGWLLLALTYSSSLWPRQSDFSFDLGVAVMRAVPMFLLGLLLMFASRLIK